METKNGLSNAKFVGVDLHTDQFTCRCLSKTAKSWQRTFKLTEDDMKEFFQVVDENTYVALEATGNSFKFKEVIESYVKEVRIYNTYKLKLISHSGRKTDKIDAEKIATQLMMEALSEMEQIKPVYAPNQTIQDLRALFTTYKQLNKQLTSTKNRIHALLKQNLYAHRKSLIFSGKNRAQILAENLSDELHFQIELLYSHIDSLEIQKEKIEKRILLLGCDYMDQIEILTSIKGISVFTAIALIADYADINRFPNAKHFTSYLRSTPKVDSSNDVTRIGRTSKHGRKLSISLLLQSVTHFRNGNAHMDSWYDKKIEHKSAGKMRMAVCRKIMVTIYVMLKNNKLHRSCDPINHQKKLNDYKRFLTKNNKMLNAA